MSILTTDYSNETPQSLADIMLQDPESDVNWVQLGGYGPNPDPQQREIVARHGKDIETRIRSSSLSSDGANSSQDGILEHERRGETDIESQQESSTSSKSNNDHSEYCDSEQSTDDCDVGEPKIPWRHRYTMPPAAPKKKPAGRRRTFQKRKRSTDEDPDYVYEPPPPDDD